MASSSIWLKKPSPRYNPNKIPEAPQLEQALQEADGSCPSEILAISQGASRVEARDAYHKLVKQYHPDQFSNIALPPEVAEYLLATVLRLNAAYKEFLDETERQEKRKKAQALKQKQQEQRPSRMTYFGE